MSITPEIFLTSSLKNIHIGASITRILASAIQSVEPENIFHNSIQLHDSYITIAENRIDIDPNGRIFLVGAGKASTAMGRAILSIISDRVHTGYIISKSNYGERNTSLVCGKLTVSYAGHPLPDEASVTATIGLIKTLNGLTSKDTVMFLLSGGGSSLLTQPAPGISIGDLRQATDLLLRSGMNINEINTIRKHLDLIKGGGLARYLYPARTIVLVISDVINDPLDMIASGPCYPDTGTYRDALRILEHYNLISKMPSSVINHLSRGVKGLFAETAKSGDEIFLHISHYVLANVETAMQAALSKARDEGFEALQMTSKLKGEAREVGRTLAHLIRSIQVQNKSIERPICIILGGETTVRVSGMGLGGRNLELALGAVDDLAGLRDIVLVTLATDGGDGPTNAAGAVVTGHTYINAHRLGLNSAKYLTNNDSYSYFHRLGDLIITGPTLTNVNDLVLLFIY